MFGGDLSITELQWIRCLSSSKYWKSQAQHSRPIDLSRGRADL